MSAWLAVVSQAHKLAPTVSVARADPATEALNVRYDPSQAPATVPCGGVQELATVVRVEIDPVSKVRGVSVVKGSGHALFDQFVAEQIARTE